MARGKAKAAARQIRLTLAEEPLRPHAGARAVRAAGSGCGAGTRRVDVKDTPENRGMIDKIRYMLRVEEA